MFNELYASLSPKYISNKNKKRRHDIFFICLIILSHTILLQLSFSSIRQNYLQTDFCCSVLLL